jgi:uncharacterized protein YukE
VRRGAATLTGMSWYGDPDDLDRQAAQLSAAADRVRDCRAVVLRSVGSGRWRGPAADAFRASVLAQLRALDRAAGELDDAAAALHRHADAVRDEIARLLTVERAATGLVRSGLSALAGAMP